MNKYRKEAKKARRQNRKDQKQFHVCQRKTAYAEDPAPIKGQHSYKCPYCKLWHRGSGPDLRPEKG